MSHLWHLRLQDKKMETSFHSYSFAWNSDLPSKLRNFFKNLTLVYTQSAPWGHTHGITGKLQKYSKQIQFCSFHQNSYRLDLIC